MMNGMNMMNKEDLQKVLNEMDPTERELALKADNALDALYSYRLSREYGVNVVCNPDGDRTKIAIDGVVMNQGEFYQWLCDKEAEEDNEDDYEEDEYVDPTHVPYLDENGDLCYELAKMYIEAYVRAMSGKYLAKGTQLAWTSDDENHEYIITNVEYGRSMSDAEFERAQEKLDDIVEALQD